MGTVTFWKTANPYLYIEDNGNDYVDSVRLSETDIKRMLKYISNSLPDIWDEFCDESGWFEIEEKGKFW